MVSLELVQEANKAYFTSKPLVGVIIGGTSGIGDYTVRALAALYGRSGVPLRLYLVGRNQTAYQTIADDCTRICPQAEFTFVKATDLALIADVDKVSAAIAKLEQDKSQDRTPKIDLLLMTQAAIPFIGRDETSEGTARNLALTCYARIRFAMKLMPLLRSAGGDAHVVSIFGAGLEHTLIKDDLSLRKPGNWGIRNAGSHYTVMQTIVYERLAKQNPQVSFVHAYPGLVETPAMASPDRPSWFKVAWTVLGPVARMFVAIPPEESGHRTLFLGTGRFASRDTAAKDSASDEIVIGTDGEKGSGMYSVGRHGDIVQGKVDFEVLRGDGTDQAIWDHVMQLFADVEAGQKFTR